MSLALARPQDNSEHPQTLREHSDETTTIALEHLPETNAQLEQAVYILTQLHDFGKLSPVYQTKFQNTDSDKDEYSLPREHSQSGAFAALFAAQKQSLSTTHQIAIFFAISKHHGTLTNVSEYLSRYTRARKGDYQAKKQLQHTLQHLELIKTTRPDEAEQYLTDAAGSPTTVTDLQNEFSSLLDTLTNYTPTEQFHRTVLQLYSLLTRADKLSAGNITLPEQTELSPERITDYISTLTTDNPSPTTRQLNTLRDNARKEVLSSLDTLTRADTSLGRITLPTGFGKTLCGLSAGLTLTSQYDHSRVIYALPYTSIIDQIDDTIQTIFSDQSLTPEDPEYTIHQSLRNTTTRYPDEDLSDSEENFLAKTWDSQLTLTTFVQLFETLAAPTNRQSVKIPALYNSVIVLDEPQALSTRWWHLIAKLIDILTTDYNATVVLMTATQPQILSSLPYTDDPINLLSQSLREDYTQFIKENPRVTLTLHDSAQTLLNPDTDSDPISHGTAASEITTNPHSNNTLSICNTINSALTLHKQITQNLNTSETTHLEINQLLQDYWNTSPNTSPKSYLLHALETTTADTISACLTTRLRPKDRQIILETISGYLDQTTHSTAPTLYLTTTQLIEAGVDISFDSLYRDFAPYPSIVQAAGRCNRNFSVQSQPVKLMYLDSPTETIQPPADTIYNARYNLIHPTKQTLKEISDECNETIPESRLTCVGPAIYYQSLHQNSQNGEEEYVSYVRQSHFNTLRQKSLIQQNYKTIELTILLTEQDRELYQSYLQAANKRKWSEAKQQQTALQQNTITIPASDSTVSKLDICPDPHQDGRYILDSVNSQQYTLQQNHGVS